MNRFLTTTFLLGLLWATAPANAQPLDTEKPETTPSATLPDHLKIMPPEGWSSLPGLGKTIAITASQTEYFGEEKIRSGAVAFGRASLGALYITWVQSERVIIEPETMIRSAFDTIHQAPYLAGSPGSTIETSYRESTLGGMSEMTWEWIHTENATVNLVRAIGWKDQNSHAHLEIAECVFPKDTEQSDKARALCEGALTSMKLNADATPAPLDALPPPKPVSTFSADDLTVPKLTTGDLSTGKSLGIPPKQLGEVLYQGNKPARQSEDNSNRIFIGIGIALLGLAIWLTTRADPNEKKSWAKDDPKPDPEADRPSAETETAEDESQRQKEKSE